MPQSYNPIAVTAVAAGSSGANIPSDAHDAFVAITSSSANFVVRLPAVTSVPVGWKTRMWVGATGCELRVSTSDTAATINNVDCVSSAFELALAATTFADVTKVDTTAWLAKLTVETGDTSTANTPN